MAGRESPAELKLRLVRQLHDARAALSTEASHAREQYRPLAIASRSFASNRLAWVAGGTVAGILLLRILWPSKNGSDISGKSAKTRGFTGLLWSVAQALAQRAVLKYAQDQIQKNFQNGIKSTLASLFTGSDPRP
jgi:hypothetical protein